ncbi:MAG: hypothetical protein MHM6MM_004265 [Cercozoa sp. M6MM]
MDDDDLDALLDVEEEAEVGSKRPRTTGDSADSFGDDGLDIAEESDNDEAASHAKKASDPDKDYTPPDDNDDALLNANDSDFEVDSRDRKKRRKTGASKPKRITKKQLADAEQEALRNRLRTQRLLNQQVLQEESESALLNADAHDEYEVRNAGKRRRGARKGTVDYELIGNPLKAKFGKSRQLSEEERRRSVEEAEERLAMLQRKFSEQQHEQQESAKPSESPKLKPFRQMSIQIVGNTVVETELQSPVSPTLSATAVSSRRRHLELAARKKKLRRRKPMPVEAAPVPAETLEDAERRNPEEFGITVDERDEDYVPSDDENKHASVFHGDEQDDDEVEDIEERLIREQLTQQQQEQKPKGEMRALSDDDEAMEKPETVDDEKTTEVEELSLPPSLEELEVRADEEKRESKEQSTLDIEERTEEGTKETVPSEEATVETSNSESENSKSPLAAEEDESTRALRDAASLREQVLAKQYEKDQAFIAAATTEKQREERKRLVSVRRALQRLEERGLGGVSLRSAAGGSVGRFLDVAARDENDEDGLLALQEEALEAMADDLAAIEGMLADESDPELQENAEQRADRAVHYLKDLVQEENDLLDKLATAFVEGDHSVLNRGRNRASLLQSHDAGLERRAVLRYRSQYDENGRFIGSWRDRARRFQSSLRRRQDSTQELSDDDEDQDKSTRLAELAAKFGLDQRQLQNTLKGEEDKATEGGRAAPGVQAAKRAIVDSDDEDMDDDPVPVPDKENKSRATTLSSLLRRSSSQPHIVQSDVDLSVLKPKHGKNAKHKKSSFAQTLAAKKLRDKAKKSGRKQRDSESSGTRRRTTTAFVFRRAGNSAVGAVSDDEDPMLLTKPKSATPKKSKKRGFSALLKSLKK